MDCEIPEVIEGQISINELLVAMGEPPVENLILEDAPLDASELLAAKPRLPGF
ncbi:MULTISPECIES: hypothetical protein [Arthrobacter]|jgi:hypothetical protein|uniref:hypothetical protein n=1 Tax=Arthrobacter TaxID=1663 RepID=UPI0014941AE0|nr:MULTISPECIES: hypothetical protein [Arthrobacter]